MLQHAPTGKYISDKDSTLLDIGRMYKATENGRIYTEDPPDLSERDRKALVVLDRTVKELNHRIGKAKSDTAKKRFEMSRVLCYRAARFISKGNEWPADLAAMFENIGDPETCALPSSYIDADTNGYFDSIGGEGAAAPSSPQPPQEEPVAATRSTPTVSTDAPMTEARRRELLGLTSLGQAALGEASPTPAPSAPTQAPTPQRTAAPTSSAALVDDGRPMNAARRREILESTPLGRAILDEEEQQLKKKQTASGGAAAGSDGMTPERRRELLGMSGLGQAVLEQQASR